MAVGLFRRLRFTPARRLAAPRAGGSVRSSLLSEGSRHMGSIAGTVVVTLLGTTSGILLARGLGVEDRGAFAAILLWPTIILSLGDLGLANSFVFFSARRPESTPSLLRTTAKVSLAQSVYLLPMGVAAAWLGLRGTGVHELLPGLLVAAAFVPAGLLARYVAAVMQGRLRLFAYYSTRASLQGVLLVCLMVFTATGSLTVWTAALSQLAGLGAMTAISLALAWPGLRRSLRPAPEVATRDLLSYGIKSFPGGLYPIEVLLLDQLVIALFLGPRDLGLYVAAVTLITVVRLVALAIGLIATPVLARTPVRRQRATTMRFLLVTAALVMPLAAGLALAAPDLLGLLFGEEFSGAGRAAQFLVLGSVAFALRRVLGDCLRGRGEVGRMSLVEMASWPLAVVAIVVGARGGIEGVAAGIAITQFLTLAGLAVVSGRKAPHDHSGIPAAHRLVPRSLAAPVGATILALLLSAAVAFMPWTWFLVTVLGIVVVAPIIYRAAHHRLDLFEPVVAIAIGLLLIVVLRPVAHLLSGELTSRGYDLTAGFDSALVLALLGTTGLYGGYALSSFARRLASGLPTLTPSLPSRATVRFSSALLLLAVLLFGAYFAQVGGLQRGLSLVAGRSADQGSIPAEASAYFYFGPFLAIPAALMLIENGFSQRRRVMIAAGLTVAAGVILLTAPRGDRIWLSVLVIATVTYIYLRLQRRPRAMTVIIAASVFVLATNVLLQQRVVEGRTESTSEAARGALTHPAREAQKFFLGPDLSMFSVLAITADAVPREIPHQPGSTLASLLAAPIPESFLSKKPQPADVLLYSALFPAQAKVSRAGTSPSLFGGLYFDGGYLLLGLGTFMAGLLARVLHEYRLLHEHAAGVRLTFALTLPLLVILLRGNPTDFTARAMYVVGPVLLFCWLVGSGSLLKYASRRRRTGTRQHPLEPQAPASLRYSDSPR